MGGNLWFTSKQGIGSTFYFTVRLKKMDAPTSPRTLVSNLTILIIDPNIKKRKILSQMISNLGCSVLQFSHVDDASDVTRHVDLILVDNKEKDVEKLNKICPKIVQMGITPRYENLSFWKSPIRESNLVEQLNKFMSNGCTSALKRSGNHGLQILLAEDNLMNQKMIQRLLRNAGYPNVDIVENGKLAVEAVEKKKYDVILMDCMVCRNRINAD